MLPGKTAGKNKGVQVCQQDDDDYGALMFVEYCLEKPAGNNKGFHFFQQYDDDHDALMCVEYCLGKDKSNE